MRGKLKSCLLLLGNTLLGVVILILAQNLKLAWLNPSILVLVFFIVLNLLYRYGLSLSPEMKKYWGLRRSYYMLWGIVGGLMISAMPTTISLVTGQLAVGDIKINEGLTISSVLITLAIVSWEELWFRGLLLNYCQRHISVITLSIVIGALFMGVHMFNPDMHFLEQGPALFFAGAFLTLLYFFYRTIWLPLGLHFGNNFFGAVVKADNGSGLLTGEDGYLSAIILALLFAFFVFRIKNRKVLLPATS
jgi:membrane protease YdiL (CAAX protease family)